MPNYPTSLTNRAPRWAFWLLTVVIVVSPPLPGQDVSSALKGKLAPDFTRSDLARAKVELRSYRGKVVLLNFWATWCGPCLTEMPSFSAWQEQYGPKKLQVVGISMDDTASEVAGVAARLKLSYPVVMGDVHLGAAYGGVLGLPVTFIIGKDGKVYDRFDGAADLPRIHAEIDRLMNLR